MEFQNRRNALKLIGAAVFTPLIQAAGTAVAAENAPASHMDALTAIRTRRSIRTFTDRDVTDAQVELLLRAAMDAPSAGNEQPWEFVVIRDRKTLEQVGGINRHAAYAKGAPVCILVCGNMHFDKFGGYWIEDVSAATQNILLAAHATGLGAVWTGIYPMADRVEAFRQLLNIPEHVVPMALVVIGYPKHQKPPADRFKPERIHKEKWQA